jgi:nucleoside-diphosphate-sugar epimerase
LVVEKQKYKILVTGANGFVGSALCDRLNAEGYNLRCAVRTPSPDENSIAVGDIGPDTQWDEALHEVDSVIHTAARAHIMKDEVPDPLAEYRKINVDGTLNLARQAAQAGVKRFIFISSIKVNGEQTPLGEPFTPEDTPAPEDPYGISKHEAEQGLQQLAQETGMDVVIIRPPLVYGPGVKGNFASMVRLVEKGIPLPLGAIHNKRSLVALDNLVDLIVTCIDHPAAANQIFLAGDGEDVSTTELLRGVAKAMGKPARLIPVPASILTLGATLLGKKAVAQRLLGSLQVDISKAREVLGWEPVVSVEEGMAKAVGMRDSEDTR